MYQSKCHLVHKNSYSSPYSTCPRRELHYFPCTLYWLLEISSVELRPSPFYSGLWLTASYHCRKQHWMVMQPNVDRVLNVDLAWKFRTESISDLQKLSAGPHRGVSYFEHSLDFEKRCSQRLSHWCKVKTWPRSRWPIEMCWAGRNIAVWAFLHQWNFRWGKRYFEWPV